MDDAGATQLIPAATVVVLRDGAEGLETLLLQRSSKLGFAAGMWVFPGGRVDEADRGPEGDEEADARRAGAREVAEEAALILDPADLVAYSHWQPPVRADLTRRFATWFFFAPAPATVVSVDGGEIVDHVWVRPAEAIGRHAAREVELLGPTWVTLLRLSEHETVAEALAAAAAGPVDRYNGRWFNLDKANIVLYAGDAGYEQADPMVTGRRHRLVMAPGEWRYLRD